MAAGQPVAATPIDVESLPHPIYGFCKRVRDDGGYRHGVERYIEAHSDDGFTHGVCPIDAAGHSGYTHDPGQGKTTRVAP